MLSRSTIKISFAFTISSAALFLSSLEVIYSLSVIEKRVFENILADTDHPV